MYVRSMGVQRLTTFVEEYAPDVGRTISIPKMAAQFGGKKSDLPVLLVDGMCFLSTLYPPTDMICGGQWRQLVLHVRSLVDKFRRHGVELVFIFDGSLESKKKDTWVKRRVRCQAEVREIFEHVSRNHQNTSGFNYFPSGLSTLIIFLLKFVCKCEVRSSLIDADFEVALIAKQRSDCFAVLSGDSDFLIFDTKPYLSMRYLDMDSLTTVQFCPDALSRKLGLERRHLPLFASLLGNDIVNAELHLRHFHKSNVRQRGPWVRILPPVVAQFIQKLGPRADNLKQVADAVGIEQSLLEESIDSYFLRKINLPYSSNPNDHIFRQQHIFCYNCRDVYNVVFKRELTLPECLEDESTTGLTPSCFLLKPIRQRWYAFLVGTPVKEWLTHSEESCELVIAQPKDFDMNAAADWSKLWSEEVDVEVENHRWDVFLSCVGVKLPQSQLRAMPPSMAVLAIILNYYLLNEKNLKDWEVHALLAQAISPLADDLPFLQKLTVNYVDERAVHIASLIMRALVTVLCVSQCCSEPLATREVMPWYFFDGKLFHYFYLQAKDGITLNQMYKNNRNLIGRHQEMFRIVTEGTHKATKMWTDQ